MSDYVITTDNTTDLPNEYVKKNGLGMMSLTYMIDGESYNQKHELPYKEFYAKMRAGSMPTTSQVNPEEAKEEFLVFLKYSKKIIHIAFSSGLSGSYNSARIAAEELMEENPDCEIVVIDSLCDSLGEGLLVHHAIQRQKAGMGYEELVKWLEEHKLNIVHNFTVDDLFHLYRGGRVSKAAAVLGTMINLKPILHVDDEGHLTPLAKVRGRKKSLTALVDSMEKQIGDWEKENDVIFISHGDCEEEAQFVAELIKERFGFEAFLINPVGPTIGTHSGPGTMALFYLGEYR